MILFDDGDELILRDGAVTVQIQPVEQLLGLGLVRLAAHHLVHGEDCSVFVGKLDIDMECHPVIWLSPNVYRTSFHEIVFSLYTG